MGAAAGGDYRSALESQSTSTGSSVNVSPERLADRQAFMETETQLWQIHLCSGCVCPTVHCPSCLPGRGHPVRLPSANWRRLWLLDHYLHELIKQLQLGLEMNIGVEGDSAMVPLQTALVITSKCQNRLLWVFDSYSFHLRVQPNPSRVYLEFCAIVLTDDHF